MVGGNGLTHPNLGPGCGPGSSRDPDRCQEKHVHYSAHRFVPGFTKVESFGHAGFERTLFELVCREARKPTIFWVPIFQDTVP